MRLFQAEENDLVVPPGEHDYLPQGIAEDICEEKDARLHFISQPPENTEKNHVNYGFIGRRGLVGDVVTGSEGIWVGIYNPPREGEWGNR